MNNNGWVKAYRDWEQHPIIAKSPNHFRVWFHLVANATHTTKAWFVGSEKITLQPGQLVTNYKQISEVTRVSESTVKNILKLFKDCQLIGLRSDRRGTLVSVLYGNSQSINKPKVDDNRSKSVPLNKNKELRNKNMCVPLGSVNNIQGQPQKQLSGTHTDIFIPPSVEEVRAYCISRGNGIDAQSFINYYASTGWRVRGETVRSWKSLVKRWEQRERSEKQSSNQFHNFEQRNYDYGSIESKLFNRN